MTGLYGTVRYGYAERAKAPSTPERVVGQADGDTRTALDVRGRCKIFRRGHRLGRKGRHRPRADDRTTIAGRAPAVHPR